MNTMSVNNKKCRQVVLDTEGQVTFTETNQGVKIELFQQSVLSDEIDKSQVRELITFLVTTL